MEGGDPSVVVSAPPKARREGSIYEKYLNIKNNVLNDEEDGAVKTCTEISNSTDEQELEAGEVYTAMRDSASIKPIDKGLRMTSPMNGRHKEFRSPRMEGSFARVSPPRMIGGPGGSLGRGRSRSRSRSRGRNGMGVPGDINGRNRPLSPPRGPPDGGRFDCYPSGGRGHFSGPPGKTLGDRRLSPGRGAFNERIGSPRRGAFDGRPGSPRRDGCYGRPGSPPRGGFGEAPVNVPRNGFGGNRSPSRGFDGGRGSPRHDGFIGPSGGPRGRSPPRNDFRRGPPTSPGRGCPPSDNRGGMMDGHGPGRPRRSRSRSQPRGPPRSPPRSYDSGPFGGRPGPRSPDRMRPRSPLRNNFGGRGPGDLSPFEDRGPLPMRRPLSPPPGGGFGSRFDNRGPPMNNRGPSPGRNGPPNMFPPRGRSRSPNGQPFGDMMRKRDRSWDRGGPPRKLMQCPFNGPLPDSPRLMEPGPYDTPSEWSFELKRSGKVKCRCSATSLSVGVSRQLPPYLDVITLPHLSRSPDFLQLERPNVRRVVYELKPESMADASGYRGFVDYLIQGRGGHARAGAATEMESQGFKIFLLPPGQAARQLGYKGDHMVAVLRSR